MSITDDQLCKLVEEFRRTSDATVYRQLRSILGREYPGEDQDDWSECMVRASSAVKEYEEKRGIADDSED